MIEFTNIFNYLLPRLRLTRKNRIVLEMNYGLAIIVWIMMIFISIYIFNI
jgi:hypothetical protein